MAQRKSDVSASFVTVQKSRDGFGSKELETWQKSAREVLNLRWHKAVFRNSREPEKMRLEGSEGCQKHSRDRLVALAATGEAGQSERPSAVLVGQTPAALTPLLWVDWMDCSLADEHVLMRSASLLCVECLWAWLPEAAWIWLEFCRTEISPASPGKVNEPGRLAGEPDIELQKPDPDF